MAITALAISFGQPYQGANESRWFLAFWGISFGFNLADTAAEAYMIDLAKQEPLEKRGQLQVRLYYKIQFSINVMTV